MTPKFNAGCVKLRLYTIFSYILFNVYDDAIKPIEPIREVSRERTIYKIKSVLFLYASMLSGSVTNIYSKERRK